MAVKLGVPLAILLVGVGWVGFRLINAVRESVDADELEVGDCFDTPTGSEIFRIRLRDCESVHEAQAVAETSVPGNGSGPNMAAIEAACVAAVEAAGLGPTAAPDDAVLGFLAPGNRGWRTGGDNTVLCYVASATGLQGQLVGD